MIVLGRNSLTLDNYNEILCDRKGVEISKEGLEKVKNSFDFLNSFFKNKVIYGINTGLGPMAQYSISDEDRTNLQYNAIRSHCAGQGNYLPDVHVKAAMITLLNSFLHGYSGIHPEVVILLNEVINKSIYPLIPEHGGVGASGDLVQLAHIALVLIGEGEVSYQKKIIPTKEAFKENNLKPISIHIREGLALINGTYVMTGIGIVNLLQARNLLDWTILASSMINEIVCSFDDYFSPELNDIKLHSGQKKVAKIIRFLLKDSKLIKRRDNHSFDKKPNTNHFKDKVQEYYSLRCVPQILGPISDAYDFAETVLVNEANSTSDNPVIDYQNNNIFHGGNFHGDYISLEMDKIKIATTKLSMLIERHINFLMNNKLNGKLPPFINLGKLGVNFGMQGVQFTAVSTTAENQTLSFPMYVHSIPNNNDNQDIVSMGTNAALITKKVIENTYQVLAIEILSIIQAVDYLEMVDSLSSFTKNIFKELRKIVPKFKEDKTKNKEIDSIKKYILSNKLQLRQNL